MKKKLVWNTQRKCQHKSGSRKMANHIFPKEWLLGSSSHEYNCHKFGLDYRCPLFLSLYTRNIELLVSFLHLRHLQIPPTPGLFYIHNFLLLDFRFGYKPRRPSCSFHKHPFFYLLWNYFCFWATKRGIFLKKVQYKNKLQDLW